MEKNQLCCNYDFDREKEKRIYRYVYKKCKKREKTSYRMIINLIHIRNGKNMYG